jgi:hypothetical protein
MRQCLSLAPVLLIKRATRNKASWQLAVGFVLQWVLYRQLNIVALGYSCCREQM